MNFEYQGGLELMFWLSQLQENTLTKEITLNALTKAFDSLNKAVYPIAEYNNVWHATFGLAIVFAEELRTAYDWRWIMIEDSADIEVGWSLISPDQKYAINVEQIFYTMTLVSRAIDVGEFYSYIEKTMAELATANETIMFFKTSIK